MKPGGAAPIKALPAIIKKTQADTKYLRTDDITAKKMGGIDFHYPAQY
jgi:hypothetical protein